MYAYTLRKITAEEFVSLCARYGHGDIDDLHAYFDAAKKALKSLK